MSLETHEGLTQEQLAKCKLGGAPFDESRLWHMDMSDTPVPSEVSAMYMVHPAPGGNDDTIFARYAPCLRLEAFVKWCLDIGNISECSERLL